MADPYRRFDWQIFKIRTKERLRRLCAWALGILLIVALILLYLWWRYESFTPEQEEKKNNRSSSLVEYPPANLHSPPARTVSRFQPHEPRRGGS